MSKPALLKLSTSDTKCKKKKRKKIQKSEESTTEIWFDEEKPAETFTCLDGPVDATMSK